MSNDGGHSLPPAQVYHGDPASTVRPFPTAAFRELGLTVTALCLSLGTGLPLPKLRQGERYSGTGLAHPGERKRFSRPGPWMYLGKGIAFPQAEASLCLGSGRDGFGMDRDVPGQGRVSPQGEARERSPSPGKEGAIAGFN
jgi:hypothetical protein